MFPLLLQFLPKIAGTAVAHLPELKALVDQVMTTLNSKDQGTLQNAYELARSTSDTAHTELQDLVAAETGR